MGLGHQGVLIFLENGARYLIHLLISDMKEGVQVVAQITMEMGKDWRRVNAKKISKATVANYMSECGTTYNFKTNNCLHASSRMMTLD
jgi:hypothetical protein